MNERIHQFENITLAIHQDGDGRVEGGSLCLPLERKFQIEPFGVFDVTILPEIDFNSNPQICVDMTNEEVYTIAASINIIPQILITKVINKDPSFYIRQTDPNSGSEVRIPIDQ